MQCLSTSPDLGDEQICLSTSPDLGDFFFRIFEFFFLHILFLSLQYLVCTVQQVRSCVNFVVCRVYRVVCNVQRTVCSNSMQLTQSHLSSFIESAVPPIILFLMIIMMPLKRCVAKKNYLIALLRNEVRKFFMSGP